MAKVVINMELKPRYGDVKRAAKELGVTSTAVRRYVSGERTALGAAHRSRIVFRKHIEK